MADKPEWSGTPTELYEKLSNIVSESVKRGRHWPGAPHVLTSRLRSVAAFLRKTKIEIELDKRTGHASDKTIVIANNEHGGQQELPLENPPQQEPPPEDIPF